MCDISVKRDEISNAFLLCIIRGCKRILRQIVDDVRVENICLKSVIWHMSDKHDRDISSKWAEMHAEFDTRFKSYILYVII